MRARQPGPRGLRRARRRQGRLRGLRRRGPRRSSSRPSPITHARSWKGLIPFLSRHVTVVTPTGGAPAARTGRTARALRTRRGRRPTCVAVLDAAGVRQTVVVAHCHAVPWALRLAADAPRPRRRARGDLARHRGDAGARLRRRGRAPLARRARRRRPGGACATARSGAATAATGRGSSSSSTSCCPEPHSTKQFEDAVAWALDTEAEAMIAEREGRGAPSRLPRPRSCAGRVRCPVLVIHGTRRPLPAAGERAAGRRAHRRRARRARRLRPPAARPRSGARSTG